MPAEMCKEFACYNEWDYRCECNIWPLSCTLSLVFAAARSKQVNPIMTEGDLPFDTFKFVTLSAILTVLKSYNKKMRPGQSGDVEWLR